MTSDDADIAALEARKLKLAEDAARRAFALAELLKIYEFREFVWNLLGETHYFNASFRGEETHLAAFVEGQRNIGQKVWIDVLTADPNIYTLMRNEALQRDKFNPPSTEPWEDDA